MKTLSLHVNAFLHKQAGGFTKVAGEPKGLPLLRFRNHTIAKEMDHPLAQNDACFTCFACPRGKLFMAKRPPFGGKERFFARACQLTFLLEGVSERVAGLPVLLETALCL